MLDPEFVAILACPQCHAPVAQVADWLVCQNPDCRLRYPIEDGIPVMLVEEAEHPKQTSAPTEAR